MATLLLAAWSLEREGIKSALASSSWEIVGETSDSREAVRLAATQKPTVLLLNPALPGCRGLALYRDLRRTTPASRLLALGDLSGEEWLEKLRRVGAAGYLGGGIDASCLREALEAAAQGVAYRKDPVAAVLPTEPELYVAPQPPRPIYLVDPLTPREEEVLRLACQGLTVLEMASQLTISHSTAQSHLRSVMLKTGIRKRAALVSYAMREGLIDPA